MFDNFFNRLWKSASFFIVGLNFIGFALIANGSNYRGSPAWELCRFLFELEFSVVKFALYGLAAAVTFFILMWLWEIFFTADESQPSKEALDRFHDATLKANHYGDLNEPAAPIKLKTSSENHESLAPNISTEVPRFTPPVQNSISKPTPPLIPEDLNKLKQKAINDILRR